MLAANLPDDLEMLLEDHRLSFAAAALRAHAPSGSDQLRGLASLTTHQLDAAAASSAASLKEELRKAQQLLQEICQAHEALAEQLSNSKYQIRKMDVGSTDDFHKGLSDRIGKRAFVALFVYSFDGRMLQGRRIWTSKRACEPSTAAWAGMTTICTPATTASRRRPRKNGFTL